MGRWYCPYCSDKPVLTPIYGRFIRAVLPVDSVGRRTAAHDADIVRRRLREDGSVYRNYERKFI